VSRITAKELKAAMDAGKPMRLIDVREPGEYDLCHINGAELIPMSQFPEKAPETLGDHETVVLYCHHGTRSMRALQYLHYQGYSKVFSLEGGIDTWAVEMDPVMKRY